MAYFIETHRLTKEQICELSKSINLYSIAKIPLSEQPTSEECTEFLERLKLPFVRMCIKRSLETITNMPTHDFYRECIENLLNELIHGSDEFNRSFLNNLTREQVKQSKELSEKIYRLMLKEKLIQLDGKTKIDTNKKKTSIVIDGINRILSQENDPIKQNQLIGIFERVDLTIPERVKSWYKNKISIRNSRKSNIKIPVRKTNESFQVKIETIHPETTTTTTNGRILIQI